MLVWCCTQGSQAWRMQWCQMGRRRDAGNAGAGRRNGERREFGELTADEHEGMRLVPNPQEGAQG